VTAGDARGPDGRQSVWRVGDIEIIAVTDGVLPTDTGKAMGIDDAVCEALSGRRRDESFDICVNQYVVRVAGRTLLIDAGASARRYPGVGLLPENLRRAGAPPESIDAVLLTHLHSDHMHGLIDDAGAAVFPNAELILHEKEAAFWLDRAPTGAPEFDRNLPAVEQNTRPYRDRLRLTRGGEVAPGVSSHLCAGHTPGHTAWRIEAGGRRAIMWGDVVHFEALQIARPDVAVAYDMDPDEAARARRRVFEMCIDEDFLVLGAHLTTPGVGRLERHGAGFRFQPT
jgi:glyoxylase-like metal-dependent hydrolase (beta-lactamase superfamily II)